MALQILTYWLISTLLGLAALPLTTYLFRNLPDRGYPFARALGLLLVGYVSWLLAMLGLVQFSRGALVLCALVVLVVGWLAARGQGSGVRGQGSKSRQPKFKPQNSRLKTLGRFSPGWRLALTYELIFLLALVFIALLRARTPDPWGTERPMDFAFFNAIQRSGTFPPHDPWLAGFSINYYYLGYLLMAAMALLSGLEAAVAFNLSLALIFALTALGVAGVVTNLIGLSLPKEKESSTDSADSTKKQRRRGRLPAVVRAGVPILAVIFVLLAGNQGGTLAIVTGMERVLYLSGGDMLRAVQNGLGPRQPLTLNQPVQEWGADKPVTVITPTDTVANFDWWWPSRAVWDAARAPGDTQAYYAITEFPMFSFFLGDMHPHVMALPFGLLALALALATLARRSAPVFTLTWRGWLELVLTGIVLGSLYMINSWDFPSYLLLYLAALVLLYVRLGQGVASRVQGVGYSSQGMGSEDNSPALQRREPLTRILWPQLAQHALLVCVASFGLFLPFYMTFKSLVGSKDPLIDLPLLGSLTRIIGFVTWDKTALHSFLIMFGLFLVPIAGMIFGVGQRLRVAETSAEAIAEREQPRAIPAGTLGIIAQPVPPAPLLPMMPWVVLAALVLGVLFGFPLLFLLPLALYALLLARCTVDNPGLCFALLAAALGALICFGTELIYIRDGFEGGAARMNTIFKFYYQVWLIWGLLAAYAVWWLSQGSGVRGQGSGEQRTNTIDIDHEEGKGRTTNNEQRATDNEQRTKVVLRLSSFVVLTFTTLLFASALTYPYFTAFKRLRDQPVIGLEGKTPRQQSAAGAASITWLRANTTGREIVLEAVGDSYDPNGGAGVSASTGLATVIGWHGSHESLWRGGDEAARAQIGPRVQDVETLYSTTDIGQARALLAQYNVDFVYIGDYERQRYAQASLDKFAELGTAVFQQDEVVVYRVGTP